MDSTAIINRAVPSPPALSLPVRVALHIFVSPGGSPMPGMVSSDMEPTARRGKLRPNIRPTVGGAVAPGLIPTGDPDDPPTDAFDRSFAWLAEIAYSDAARPSTG
jgi:hypothetical protein